MEFVLNRIGTPTPLRLDISASMFRCPPSEVVSQAIGVRISWSVSYAEEKYRLTVTSLL